MPEKILYTAEALSTGDGRNGHIVSTDNWLDLDLRFPKSMGGTGEGTNPEQLFAAGYAACFHTALRIVAQRARADVTGSTVTAQVSIGPEGEGFGLAVTLLVHLPDVPADTANELTGRAHQVCPYSRATRGNITVDLQVV
ncbi:MAG: organic hydroperoxide resistance protein [Mycobacterium sp.]|nr:organic hydroperoxide resistance protein [Mycobacterium sp.]